MDPRRNSFHGESCLLPQPSRGGQFGGVALAASRQFRLSPAQAPQLFRQDPLHPAGQRLLVEFARMIFPQLASHRARQFLPKLAAFQTPPLSSF